MLPGGVRLAGCAGGGSDAAARCHYSFPALARPWRQARLSAFPPDVDPVRTVDGGTGDFNVARCHPRTLVHLGCGRTRIEPDIHAGRFCDSGSHDPRSEEHTSELQSLMRISYAVFCLKKKITNIEKQDSDFSHIVITDLCD